MLASCERKDESIATILYEMFISVMDSKLF